MLVVLSQVLANVGHRTWPGEATAADVGGEIAGKSPEMGQLV